MTVLLANWHIWLWTAGIVAAAILIGVLAHRVFYWVARRFAARRAEIVPRSLVRRSERPARWLFPAAATLLASPFLPLAPDVDAALRHCLVIVLMGTTTWLAAAVLGVVEDVVGARYRLDAADNLQARSIGTQVRVLMQIATAAIVLVGFAAILMTFPTIRDVGAGLFASAGVAGLVAGMAARPTLSNLLAGIQIAMAEPMRLDDVVVVEGEWGRIEDIRTTYVVVRIWDQRRLILPLSYFIEHPFQNWTRTSAEILGTVFLRVDYRVRVEELRAELHRILESSEFWDGKVWNLQVTDAGERTVELRALMSSSDSGKAWNLRCLVRERMIGFLQEKYPDSLPRVRAELAMGEAGQTASSSGANATDR